MRPQLPSGLSVLFWRRRNEERIIENLSIPIGGSIVMSTFLRDTDTVSMSALSVFLIVPDEQRRRALAQAFSGAQARIARELASYPAMDDVGQIADSDCDVIVVDLDPDAETALDVVENICGANSSVTVMIYAAHAAPDMLVRCMRAGAREFLSEPLQPGAVAEALVRASVRREEVRRSKKTSGKVLVFAGAKGGAGVTTVATNFALTLAKDSAKVLLIDLDLHLGDAALAVGVSSKFSTADALENTNRLDSDFLSVMLAKHSSGLSVLAGPDAVSGVHLTREAVEKLLRIAGEDFDYVVVDAGANPADVFETLFDAATAVYLVTQLGIPDLRNANRLINRYFSGTDGKKLEVVLNRFLARSAEIDDAAITKALTRPAKWRVPNDFPAARKAQNSGVPIAMEDSPISRIIREMAWAASGQTGRSEKKRRFGLFG
jgi:pilus assembly protein CpaE